MAVTLTSHGQGASGVVRLLIEDGRGAFLFDCGDPTRGRHVRRPQAADMPPDDGMPPLLAHAYRPEAAEAGGAERNPLDGVLISHAHSRHVDGVPLLRDDVPIYASVMTAALLKARQDISAAPGIQDEFVFVPGVDTVRQRPYTFLLTQNDSAAPPGEPVAPFSDVRDFWRAVPDGLRDADIFKDTPAAVLPQAAPGGLNGRALRHYPVDHSILGAAAFAVETPDGWICYTGDIRFHGSQPGLMEEFVAGFADLRPFALIVDGEHTEPGAAPTTERDVYDRVTAAVRDAPGLIAADFDVLDMERLLTFNSVAEQTGRQLVLSLRDAFMIQTMGIVWRQFPSLDEVATLRILDDAPASDGPAPPWQRAARDRCGSILLSVDEMRARGGAYILRTSRDEPGVEGAIGANGGALHIHSRPGNGPPRSQGRGRAPGRAATESRGHAPGYFHASGHATFDETLAMIRRIAPRHVIPAHSARPERFAEALTPDGFRVSIPREGQPLLLA